MSGQKDWIRCGYGLYVRDVDGGNALISRRYPPGSVEIERADIPDVIEALQAVLDGRQETVGAARLAVCPEGEP